jgi:hypothetical protein
MNGFGPEGARTLPIEARPIQGVASIIVDRNDLIYTVVEKTSRPEYGKEAGMRTPPMETVIPGETPDQTLSRLFQEEVHERLTILGTEMIGLYGLNSAGVKLFVVHVDRSGHSHNGNGYNHNINGHEVTDPKWLKPEELMTERVRMGVAEMIGDYVSGNRDVRRECKPVPLGLPHTNGTHPVKY